MTFDDYVRDWRALVSAKEKLEKSLKALREREVEMRLQIAGQIRNTLGEDLKEGVNYYGAGDTKLKLNYKINWKVDPAKIQEVRQEYEKLNDVPVIFDEIIRVKHELSKTAYNKLGSTAKGVVSVMLTSTPATPELTMDE